MLLGSIRIISYWGFKNDKNFIYLIAELVNFLLVSWYY